ncbi:hypothetical protein AcW1_005779 [Taiwanofungus camphoratus]|nr:hypothetical protein AcW1_005779 [Antrodia cinnamomea]
MQFLDRCDAVGARSLALHDRPGPDCRSEIHGRVVPPAGRPLAVVASGARQRTAKGRKGRAVWGGPIVQALRRDNTRDRDAADLCLKLDWRPHTSKLSSVAIERGGKEPDTSA